MSRLQEADYGAGRDYAYGSPHLTHRRLTAKIEAELHELVGTHLAAHGRCRVLEVGAGHGTFTQTLLEAGASVTVTEMSAPSAAVLSERFAGDERCRVVHDPEGTTAARLAAEGTDAIVMISVVHHIPDYLTAIGALVDGLEPDGWFYSTMDPTWYPARRRAEHLAEQGSYLAWRITQGNLLRGLRTRARRLRRGYVESEPSDMVEYHTVRQGVDQRALVALLQQRFTRVDLDTFWSTQGRLFQRLGERTRLTCTFGITARHRG